MLEVSCLVKIGVLASAFFSKSQRNIQKTDHLTARFLKTFRRRLVAREHSFFDTKEDVYAPAFGNICNKLHQAIVMSEICDDSLVMGPLDISDAHLQVDQHQPNKIHVIDRPHANFTIHRRLPGQRDGASRWYDLFC